MDDLIEALQIFKKYLEGYTLDYPTHCEHDVLMVGGPDLKPSKEDAHRLNELSFSYDEGYECWVSYKYGSS